MSYVVKLSLVLYLQCCYRYMYCMHKLELYQIVSFWHLIEMSLYDIIIEGNRNASHNWD